MTPPSPAGLVRQRLVALAMVGAPVLLASGSLLTPAGVDSKADSLQATVAQLQDAAVHRGQVFAAFLLHVLAGLLLIPAVGGLLRLAPERGAALATIGGVLAGIGAGFIAVDAALFGLTSYFAAAPGLDQAAVARYLFAMKADPGAYVLFFAYLLFPLGILPVALGLLRAHTVPRWQPWLLLAGTLLGAASEAGIAAGLEHLPLIAAFTALAVHLWRPGAPPPRPPGAARHPAHPGVVACPVTGRSGQLTPDTSPPNVPSVEVAACSPRRWSPGPEAFPCCYRRSPSCAGT